MRRLGDDRVARGEHLHDRGEVAAAAVDRVRDDAEDRAEAGADEHRGDEDAERAPVGEKMKNSRPRNVPNQAPDSAPAPAARPQVSLPVMRSTLVRSVPTIASSFTGNSALASESTASCASA